MLPLVLTQLVWPGQQKHVWWGVDAIVLPPVLAWLVLLARPAVLMFLKDDTYNVKPNTDVRVKFFPRIYQL